MGARGLNRLVEGESSVGMNLKCCKKLGIS